jgi:hypothetical protein
VPAFQSRISRRVPRFSGSCVQSHGVGPAQRGFTSATTLRHTRKTERHDADGALNTKYFHSPTIRASMRPYRNVKLALSALRIRVMIFRCRQVPHSIKYDLMPALWNLRSGPGEIRTHETLSGLPVFKTGAFNRSATGPNFARVKFLLGVF